MKKICKRCGKEFETKYPHKKFCSFQCKGEYETEYRREYQRRYRWRDEWEKYWADFAKEKGA